MRIKRCLSLFFLTAVLLLCCTSTALAATYTDTAGHWAEEAIERWSDAKVLQGANNLFRPDEGITRGEMALILDRIMQYEESSANTFNDLPETWYTEAVLQANAAGVILGYDGLIRPNEEIKREEAIVMIARACGMDDLLPSGEPLPYGDTGSISSWAYNIIAAFCEAGYITDSTDFLRPQESITRAETAVLLDNIITRLWREDGLYNAAVEGNAVISGEKAMLLNTMIFGDLVISGGATETVILQSTSIFGRIINKSNAEIIQYPTGMENLDTLFFRDQELPVLSGVAVNPYAAVDFSETDGRMQYIDPSSGLAAITGIDVSEWQKEIDWWAVAEDDVDFAFIRAGYRGNTEGKLNADTYFTQNMQGALAAGLDVGVYFYSQAVNVLEAVEEAQFVLDMIAPFANEITYPIVFDWELAGTSDARTNNMDAETLTACATAFAETIANAGYTPMIYMNSDLAYLYYDLTQLTDYPLWYAGYSNAPDYYYDFDIWQYTSSGSVDGIEGRVDLNLDFCVD